MARRVNIGLIGAGVMGRVHARNLASRVLGARLAAVADIDRAAAEACAQECGVDAVYDNSDALLTRSRLDAVVICTPPATHAGIVEAAAAAGLHVFCEKPLDTDLGRIDRALAGVGRAGVKLQVGFNRRFDPDFRRVRDLVASGAIGRPLTLHIVARDPPRPSGAPAKPPGDLFLDTTIHDLDMARFLLGEVAEVYCAGGAMAKEKDAADDPDTAVTLLRFESGAVGSIHNSRLSVQGYDQRLEVFGSAGSVEAGNEREQRVTARADERSLWPPDFFVERYAESYREEMATFIDCILECRDSPVSGAEGRRAVVLALAAWRSYREGRPVGAQEVAGGAAST